MKCVYDCYSNFTAGTSEKSEEVFDNFPSITGRNPPDVDGLCADARGRVQILRPAAGNASSTTYRLFKNRARIVGSGNWTNYGATFRLSNFSRNTRSQASGVGGGKTPSKRRPVLINSRVNTNQP